MATDTHRLFLAACLVLTIGCGFVKVRIGDPSPPDKAPPQSKPLPVPPPTAAADAPFSVATPIDPQESSSERRSQTSGVPPVRYENSDQRRLRGQCESSYEARRLESIARAARQVETAKAQSAREDERRRLAEYQKNRCHLTVEDVIDREPCDDGSDVVKMCNFVVDQIHWATCPASAPAEVRGKHSLIAMSAIGRSAPRSAMLASAGAPPMDSMCQQYDREIEKAMASDGGADASE